MKPIWICLVKIEDLNNAGHFAYRIVQAIPSTFGQHERIYAELSQTADAMREHYVMVFMREPDLTPMVDAFRRQTA